MFTKNKNVKKYKNRWLWKRFYVFRWRFIVENAKMLKVSLPSSVGQLCLRWFPRASWCRIGRWGDRAGIFDNGTRNQMLRKTKFWWGVMGLVGEPGLIGFVSNVLEKRAAHARANHSPMSTPFSELEIARALLHP